MSSQAAPQQVPVGFGKQGASYARFRPDYPPDLYKLILAPSKPAERRLAIDVATGSGQAARNLSAYFQKVVAIDLDSEQLKHADDIHNVIFKLAAAEQLDMKDGCADLVAVAAGLHWFELDKFFPEAHRVLKPSGYIAAWGYDLLLLPGKPNAQQLIHDFYHITLGQLWHPRLKHVERHYKDIAPPAALFKVQHEELEVKVTMTLSQLAGFLSTWSAYNTYRQLHPEKADPLEDFKTAFRKAAAVASDEEQFEAIYPLFVMLCFPRQ